MVTKRDLLKIAAGLGAANLVTAISVDHARAAALGWQFFPAGEEGFFRAPVLLEGEKEAVLIDGCFTLSDGLNLAEAVKSSGKTLSTIYISQSDPDYYFGLAPLKAAFPRAKIIAASAVIAAIQESAAKKLAVWAPKLKNNGPQKLSDLVIPTGFNKPSFDLEGQVLEIVEVQDLVNRRYIWVPSLSAIFGGVLVFAGVHVWTADLTSASQRTAWLKALDAMAARNPTVVVPGHMMKSLPTDDSALSYTRDYLLAFEEQLAKAKDSTALIAAMKELYPDAGMLAALEIGAKVAKGEMKWD